MPNHLVSSSNLRFLGPKSLDLRCMAARGGTWRHLGGTWKQIRGVLEASWGLLSASWRFLEASWRLLEASWSHLGGILKTFRQSEKAGPSNSDCRKVFKGANMAARGGSWRHLGRTWRHIRGSWRHLGGHPGGTPARLLASFCLGGAHSLSC